MMKNQMSYVLTPKDILHYGSIISISILKNKSKYLYGDGYGSDKVFFDDFQTNCNKLFSKALFMVLPSFTNDQKKSIPNLPNLLSAQNCDSKKKRSHELLQNLYQEYLSNIEVLGSNSTTPIKFNLVTFQLYHINSNKYLSLSDEQLTGESVRLTLVEEPGPLTLFKFTPSLKYQVEGECFIYFGSGVRLTSAKEVAGLYPSLHCFSSYGQSVVEPTFSVMGETDIVLEYYKSESDDLEGQTLLGGDLIMISQLDHNLVLSVMNDLKTQAQRFSEGKSSIFRLDLDPFIAKEFKDTVAFTDSIWAVEHLSKTVGRPITWNDNVRFLNMAAREYLSLNISNRDKPFFELRPLSPDTLESTIFRFFSSSNPPLNKPIKKNDYVTIKAPIPRLFMGIKSNDNGSYFELEALPNNLDSNTFKISKNERYSNEISYFQVSIYSNLTDLLQFLKKFRSVRAYQTSQELRKQLFAGIKLIIRMRLFVNNKNLISNIKEKFGQKNPLRQEFLAQLQYILFLSMILSNLFDAHELNMIEGFSGGTSGVNTKDEKQEKQEKKGEMMDDDSDDASKKSQKSQSKAKKPKTSPPKPEDVDPNLAYLSDIEDLLEHRLTFEELVKSSDFKYRASSKTTETLVMKQFIDLLKAKIFMANEVYGLLKDICYNNPQNQQTAYDCAVYFMNHFQAIPVAGEFLSYLLCQNKQNSYSLRKNFDFNKIRSILPNENKLDVDLIVQDKYGLLTENFSSIRKDLLLDKVNIVNKRRLVNPIIYIGSVISTTDNMDVKRKCIRTLSAICKVNGMPFTLTQDLLYKIILLVPELRAKVFRQFSITDGEINVETSIGTIPAKDLGKLNPDFPDYDAEADFECFVEQLELFAALGAGRNIPWKPVLEEAFPAEFLFTAIWNPDYQSFRGSLFSILYSVYIDQFPVEIVRMPQAIRYISEFGGSTAKNHEALARAKINRTSSYPRHLISSLLTTLLKDLSRRVIELDEATTKTISENLTACRFKREIFVPDLPQEILSGINFILKLMRLQIFDIFERKQDYSTILKHIMTIFNYNQLYPSQFSYLKELKAKEHTGGKKMKTSKKKSKKQGMNYIGFSEDTGETSLLWGSYFALKNQIFNGLNRATRFPTSRHVEARATIVEILHIFLDLRQQFLLENYTDWVWGVVQKFSGKPYSEANENKIFSMCSKEVKKTVPALIKTGIRSVDADSDQKTEEKFTRYLPDTILEIYDLCYLYSNPPDTQAQDALPEYESLIPDLIMCVLTTDEEKLSVSLMSLIFRVFSQRKEFFKNIKSSFLVSKQKDRELYDTILEYSESLDEIIRKVKYWSINETMIMEAVDMIKFIKEITNRLFPGAAERQNKNASFEGPSEDKIFISPESANIHMIQDIMYHSKCYYKIIKIYRMVVNAFKEYQDAQKFEEEKSKLLMLTILHDCLTLLREFVRGNSEYKNILIKDLDAFLEFTRYNVGQSDLVSELFVDNPKANFDSQKKMIGYFSQKIITEGNQVRFLSFFDSFIETHKNSSSQSLACLLDTFLPYNIDPTSTDSMKLIYGFINMNTNEHEMYLMDDFSSFKEDKYNDILAFKSEPFLFHQKLLSLYLKLMTSELANITKLRLRKYFSLNYVMRFLFEDDFFFENKVPDLVDEEFLASIPNKRELYKVGVTWLKPYLVEIFYRIYCKGEKNIYRSIVPSLNLITNLMTKETERMEELAGQYDMHYSKYISYLLKIFMKMFENKVKGKFDLGDYESELMFKLIQELLNNSSLLANSLSKHQVEMLKIYVKSMESENLSTAFENAKETILRIEEENKDYLTNVNLEEKAAMVKIKEFSFGDIWDISIDEINTHREKLETQETDNFAQSMFFFEQMFNKELNMKYGLGFKLTEFLTKILSYLSSTMVTSDEKINCIGFLIRFIETSDNMEAIQNLLDKIGLTKSVLMMLIESSLNDDKFTITILEFLNALLRGGNINIQRTIYQFFSTTDKLTSNLFIKINTYFTNFSKLMKDPIFESSLKYDSKLTTIERMIKFFQLLCENHFEDMQDYLRTQNNLRKKVNFLEIICLMLKECSSRPVNKTFNLFNLSIDFLIEMIQGPCYDNQKNLVELNLVTTLNTILKWKKNDEDYTNQITSSLTVRNKTRLTKLKLSKTIASETELNFKSIEKNLKGKFRMSNPKIVLIKYKSLVCLLALIEMQRDKNILAKVKKEVQFSSLKHLMIEVYIDFFTNYKKKYSADTLNHFDQAYLGKLSKDQKKEAKKVILETGFFCVFFILKLYNYKLEKEEDIKEDLSFFQEKEVKYEDKGFLTEKFLASYKQECLERALETRKKASMEEIIQFTSRKEQKIFEEAATFFYYYTAKIEVFRSKRIQEIYFIKMPYTVYLDDADKDNFNLEVDRSTTLNKVKELVDRVNYFTITMKFAYLLKTKSFLVKIIFNYEWVYTLLSFVAACLINLMIVASFRSTDEKDQQINMTRAFMFNKVDQTLTIDIIKYSGWALVFIGFRFWVFHIMKLLYMRKHSKDYRELWEGVKWYKSFYNRLRFFLNSNIIYYSCYLAFAFLGIFQHVFFFAFHLYEIMNQFKTCRIFIKSITVPYKQLILTFIFYNILVFEYAVIGFLFFWRFFWDGETANNPNVGNFCDELYICYLTIYDITNKETGGIGSLMDGVDEGAFLTHNYRALFDNSCKFFVQIILLSIVKGIIVDTFGALREEDQEKTSDMESKCYICGIERESFDKVPTKTFQEHIKTSHNMWDYLFLLDYLIQKNRQELNGEESYVFENYLKDKYDWVPNKRCLEIDDSEETTINDQLRDRLEPIKDKMDSLKDEYKLISVSLSKYIRTRQ